MYLRDQGLVPWLIGRILHISAKPGHAISAGVVRKGRAGLPAFLLLLLVGLCCGGALADARVQVKADQATLHVYAEIATTADRDTAWAVLTDYNHWSEFLPDMTVCRVISQPGEPLRLEQRGMVPWLANFPLVMIAAIEENPRNSIRFQRLAGNIQALVGEWHIQGRNPVRLVYRASVIPGFPMPPEVTSEIFRLDAKSRLEAMAREMNRRAGSGR